MKPYYSDPLTDAANRGIAAISAISAPISAFEIANPDPDPFPMVSEGASDFTVASETNIQGLISLITKTLEAKGYLNFWGTQLDSSTVVAIKAFQTDHGLNADGVVGPRTYSALFGSTFRYYSPSLLKTLIPLAPIKSVDTGTATAFDYVLLATALGTTFGAIYLIYTNAQRR